MSWFKFPNGLFETITLSWFPNFESCEESCFKLQVQGITKASQ